MKPRSSRHARPLPIRWQAYAVAALVLLAILFGGGGVEGPMNNGLIQGLSAVLIALLIASHVQGSWPLPRAAGGFTWLFLALMAIVLLQLVPLPPTIWQSLPGRDLAQSSLALVGATNEWRPLSLDPDATRRFGASLLLPAAIIYGMLGATRREALLVVRALLIAAGISALLGGLQLALGNPSWIIFYERPNPGTASGIFANANHHASLMVSAILLLAVLIRTDRGPRAGFGPFHPAWIALPFFIVITLATGSRAGVIMLAIAVPGALLIGLAGRSPLLWLGGLAAAVLVGAVIALFSPSGNALAIGQSFIFTDDSRYSFLPDVIYTVRQYWPWGSGFGTFVQTFAPNENLDVAGAGFVNRAHNDLVEFLLEAGILGAIWLVAVAGLLAWRVVGVARKRSQLRGSQVAAVVAGALVLVVLALHSLVDYPIRIAAISAVMAVAAGLALTPLTDAPPRPLSRRGGRWPFIAAAVAGLVVAVLVIRIFAAEAAIRQENGALATTLRPQSGRALALAAEEQMRNRNTQAAQELARAAIARTPLNSTAVRVLAMSLPPEEALEPWRLASAMGWRDAPTQLWALQQALANGEFEVAAVRADAFLRTRRRRPQEYVAVVRVASLDPRFRAALVERLSIDPEWRANFFALPQTATQQEIQGTAETLVGLAATGRPPALGEATNTILRLIEHKQYGEALNVYRQVSGDRTDGLLSDGGFDRPLEDYRTNRTPFDWLLRSVAGGTASVEGQDGRFLFVETDGNAARTLLSRYVPITAGTYRLSYLRRGEPDSPEAILITVRCVDGPQLGSSSTDPLESGGFEQRQISFDVGPNCPMILISIEAKAVGRPAAAEFDEFSLERTR